MHHTRNLDRIGLIVNPCAGRGEGLTLARDALRHLAPREVLAGAGEMGAEAARDLPLTLGVVDWSLHTGTSRTTFLAKRFAGEHLDALVVIGGDGTLADVAFTLWNERVALPLLGIGAGSANVGPLITCPGREVRLLSEARWTTRRVAGLVAGVNGTNLGLGFNDVVIGFTVLATVNGTVVDVDAAEKMQGRSIPREPEFIGAESTRVTKKTQQGETVIMHGASVATVIVGFPDERFFGKAIAGGVIMSGLVGDPAGCLVCDHLLVRTQVDAEGYRRSEPIVSHYVGLNETEQIETLGLREGAVLCADGNPLAILSPGDRAHVIVRRALAESLQIQT